METVKDIVSYEAKKYEKELLEEETITLHLEVINHNNEKEYYRLSLSLVDKELIVELNGYDSEPLIQEFEHYSYSDDSFTYETKTYLNFNENVPFATDYDSIKDLQAKEISFDSDYEINSRY